MEIRRLMLERFYLTKSNLISSNLSICDVIWCLYDSVLNTKPSDFDDKKNNERDRFILSKGHGALALYTVLYLKQYITKNDFDSYYQNDSVFGNLIKHYVKGVEFSSGSLGIPITFAVGEALAAKIQRSNRKIYCLISDGETNEGSCWEAFMFACHHKCNNLIIMYDNNKRQAMGYTKDVIENNNIIDKMQAFGFEIIEMNGHNHKEIKKTFIDINNKINDNIITKPIFINIYTISGKGISFMEDKLEWHYKSMNEDEYNLALSELI